MWVCELFFFFFTLAGFALDSTLPSSVFIETLMGKHNLTHFVLFSLVILVPCLCLQDVLDNATTSVYVVTLKQAPTSHSYGVLTRLNDDNNGFKDNGRTQFQKPRYHSSNSLLFSTFCLGFVILLHVIWTVCS